MMKGEKEAKERRLHKSRLRASRLVLQPSSQTALNQGSSSSAQPVITEDPTSDNPTTTPFTTSHGTPDILLDTSSLLVEQNSPGPQNLVGMANSPNTAQPMVDTATLDITGIPPQHPAVVLFKEHRHRIIELVEVENPAHGDYVISLLLFEGAPTVFVLSNPALSVTMLRCYLSDIGVGCEAMVLRQSSLLHRSSRVKPRDPHYHQIVFPGNGIGVDSIGGAGTLGCYLKGNNGKTYALTNAHLMAVNEQLGGKIRDITNQSYTKVELDKLKETCAAGENVSQPALMDYEYELQSRIKRWVREMAKIRKPNVPTQNQLNTVHHALDEIAALAVDTDFGKTTEINKIDAGPWAEDSGWEGLYHYLDYALIECKPERIGSNRIANEIFVSEIAKVTPYCQVMKYGRTSGWTTGTTNGVESIIYNRRCPNLHFAEHTVGPQRSDRDFTSCGDSGAAIIGRDEDDPSTLDKIVGINYGGGSTTKGSINCSFMTKIQNIFEDIESSFQLKVELLPLPRSSNFT